MYSIQTLNEYCAEHKVILNTKYDSVNRDTRINGICLQCPEPFDKTFRRLKKVGAYCPDCSKNLGMEKNVKYHTERTTDGSRQNYNYLLLDEYCKTNKVKIEGDYNRNINRNTIVNGNCTKCETKFDKTFRELIKIGAFCADCALEIGKAKIIETTLSHYGVEHSMQSAEVREKSKVTMMQKYGVENASQMPQTQEKFKQTSLLRYGVEHPQQSTEIKEKAKATNYLKYGVSHYTQNPECSERNQKRAFSTKKYTLPSGRILNYQGYENFGLDRLLNDERIQEDDIVTARTEVPEIWYNDKAGKRRRHYVDIYIKSQNRCVEIKSTWTSQQEKNSVYEKQAAAKLDGLKYEIWIFSHKGKLLEMH